MRTLPFRFDNGDSSQPQMKLRGCASCLLISFSMTTTTEIPWNRYKKVSLKQNFRTPITKMSFLFNEKLKAFGTPRQSRL